jgi:hypothetical protein
MTAKLWWNVWIMANYIGASIWWLSHGSRADALYWLFACGITGVVTFGYPR